MPLLPNDNDTVAYCFLGVIKEQPQHPADEYEVLFEDPTYADGYSPPLTVAQRYIIQVAEKKNL